MGSLQEILRGKLELFLQHALDHHPQAKECLSDFQKFSFDFKICQGVNRYDCLDTNMKLLEQFNEEIVSRSIQCVYYLSSSETEFQCKECQKVTRGQGLPIKQETNDFPFPSDFNLDNFDENVENELIEEKPLKRKSRKSRKKVNYDVEQSLSDLEFDPNLEIKLETGEYSYKEEFLENFEDAFGGAVDDDEEEIKPKPKRKYRKRKKKGEDGDVPEDQDDYEPSPYVMKQKGKKIKSEDGYEETCQICLKEFYSRQAFEEDLLKHRGFFDIDGLVNCPICHESMSKMSLNPHFAHSHSQDGPKHVCVVCFEVIPGTKITNVRKHLQQHCLTKPSCPDCGKEMGSTRYLILHMELVHGRSCKEGSICCDRCGKMFPSKTLLLKHKQKTVCAAEEWACNLCPKIFDYKHRFRTHLKVHCGLKPYICPHCQYG